MCLNVLTWRAYDDDEFPVRHTANTGYKVFKLEDGKLYHSDQCRDEELPVNQWLGAQTLLPIHANRVGKGVKSRFYIPGFHVFTTIGGARSWARDCSVATPVVRKVTYRHVVAKGIQQGHRINVALAIKIEQANEPLKPKPKRKPAKKAKWRR